MVVPGPFPAGLMDLYDNRAGKEQVQVHDILPLPLHRAATGVLLMCRQPVEHHRGCQGSCYFPGQKEKLIPEGLSGCPDLRCRLTIGYTWTAGQTDPEQTRTG